MKKRFENNSNKQRKLYGITQNAFNYWDMKIIINSLSDSYRVKIDNAIKEASKQIDYLKNGIYTIKNSRINRNTTNVEVQKEKEFLSEKVKKDLIIELNRIYIKTFLLFIIDFSNKWEKYMRNIFALCEIEIEGGKNNQYGRNIEPLIKEHFKTLYNSDVYKDIKKLREIANKVKHDESHDEQIINKYLEDLLDIQVNIFENKEGHIRELSDQDDLEDIDKEHFSSLVKTLDKDKKDIKSERKLNISYILENFNYNINQNWIWKEFSFNMQDSVSVSYGNTSAIFTIFSEQEKKAIQNNSEKYIRNSLNN
ncbi:MAG: hypothetical protein KFW07_01320 [Mycoplasmataceae bacterium]|nr:hypothetical protein [Mycoplasmataceae bacterium]